MKWKLIAQKSHNNPKFGVKLVTRSKNQMSCLYPDLMDAGCFKATRGSITVFSILFNKAVLLSYAFTLTGSTIRGIVIKVQNVPKGLFS